MFDNVHFSHVLLSRARKFLRWKTNTTARHPLLLGN